MRRAKPNRERESTVTDLRAMMDDYAKNPRRARRKRSDETPKGYAAEPGTGPVGETCKTCGHSDYVECAKRYWKCDLRRHTASYATDIRLKSPACKFWKGKEK